MQGDAAPGGLRDLVQALTLALEAKSGYTRSHCDRVAELSRALALELGLDADRAESAGVAGQLHDIGKLGISDAIIGKPGELDEAEFETMKGHSAIGSSLVLQLGSLQVFSSSIRAHHERWDGEGYPDSLSQDSIPLEARIICVADAWDAMTSARSYSGQVEPPAAFEELRARSGRQFDPSLVEALGRLYRSGRLPLAAGMRSALRPTPPAGYDGAHERRNNRGRLRHSLSSRHQDRA
jgi:putative nucleotidyltransferase with HDIG domain